MAIAKETVEAAVEEISQKMENPNFVQSAVERFVDEQPDISRYISSCVQRVGGPEKVVHLVFHAEVVAACVRQNLGSRLSPVDFMALNEVAQGQVVERLEEAEPALASYVESNAEDDEQRQVLSIVALALADADRL